MYYYEKQGCGLEVKRNVKSKQALKPNTANEKINSAQASNQKKLAHNNKTHSFDGMRNGSMGRRGGTGLIFGILAGILWATRVGISGEVPWTTTWISPFGGSAVQVGEDGSAVVTVSGGDKGVFLERTIPPQELQTMGNVTKVVLELEITGMEGEEHELQFLLQTPGMTSYRQDAPIFLQARLKNGQPTIWATVRGPDSQKKETKRTPGLAAGATTTITALIHWEAGETKIVMESGGKQAELLRNFEVGPTTASPKGLQLLLKGDSPKGASITLKIRGRLEAGEAAQP